MRRYTDSDLQAVRDAAWDARYRDRETLEEWATNNPEYIADLLGTAFDVGTDLAVLLAVSALRNAYDDYMREQVNNASWVREQAEKEKDAHLYVVEEKY